MILGNPVLHSVLTLVYFGIAKYRVQFIDIHRVIHPGNFNLYCTFICSKAKYFHARGAFVEITLNYDGKNCLLIMSEVVIGALGVA